MRGRKPKPSYLAVLDGGASHSRKANPDEPIPDGDLDAPPEGLPPRQIAIWQYAIRHTPPGMLKLIDRSVFAAWVAAVDTFERARTNVDKYGLLVKTPSGAWIQNPYLPIQNKQGALIKQYAAELGFSPTARPRVKVSKKTKASNPFADLKELDD
jgi:P27 family predicted phage terminase small subunit